MGFDFLFFFNIYTKLRVLILCCFQALEQFDLSRLRTILFSWEKVEILQKDFSWHFIQVLIVWGE